MTKKVQKEKSEGEHYSPLSDVGLEELEAYSRCMDDDIENIWRIMRENGMSEQEFKGLLIEDTENKVNRILNQHPSRR